MQMQVFYVVVSFYTDSSVIFFSFFIPCYFFKDVEKSVSMFFFIKTIQLSLYVMSKFMLKNMHYSGVICEIIFIKKNCVATDKSNKIISFLLSEFLNFPS